MGVHTIFGITKREEERMIRIWDLEERGIMKRNDELMNSDFTCIHSPNCLRMWSCSKDSHIQKNIFMYL